MENNITIKDTLDLIPVVLSFLKTEDHVGIVSNFETVWCIAEELYNSAEFYFDLIDINRTEYDREYLLYIMNDGAMSIERIYDEASDMYLASDGVVFISDDVNSKYVVDCENNKYIDDFRPVYFGSEEADNDSMPKTTTNKDDKENSDKKDGVVCVYCTPSYFNELVTEFDNAIDRLFKNIFK